MDDAAKNMSCMTEELQQAETEGEGRIIISRGNYKQSPVV